MAIEASLDLGNIANCQVNNVKVMNQCLHLVDTYRLQCDERWSAYGDLDQFALFRTSKRVTVRLEAMTTVVFWRTYL